MRTILTITILILTQAINAQQAVTNPAVLSPKAMEAYVLKAESKAGEFFSYLELLTDPTANIEMKTQTAAEAAKLYQNNGVIIENVFDPKGGITDVKKLLGLAGIQKQKTSFSIMSFNIISKGENSKRRDWLMTYELLAGKRVLNISQGFYIVLEEKKFGSTIKQVWNTYLGEMRVNKKP